MENVTKQPESSIPASPQKEPFHPIVTLDIESTGTDPVLDRIASIGMVRSTDGAEFYQLVNPWRPMPAEATAIHGLTDEMLHDQQKFAEIADRVLAFIGDHDICTFGGWGFDLPILAEELGRCGKVFQWKHRCIFDAGVLMKKKEQRTLEAAVEMYCKRKHEGAHNALEDAKATFDVFRGQLLRYTDLQGMDRAKLHEFCQFEPRVDLAGKLAFNLAGEVVYNFSKQKGVRVLDDPGFGVWMLSKEFTADTKSVLRGLLYPDSDTGDETESQGDLLF